MGRRDRERRPARRAARLDPKPTILVLCEGTVTEREYLDGFKTWCRNPRVRVEYGPSGATPRTLVREAKARKRAAEDEASRERDDNLAYDEVWCVFDVDEHPEIGDARQMARDNGIELAVSNPCFELWLLLHLRGSPGAQHRDHVRRMLEKLLPGYDKHVDFTALAAGYSEASGTARKLDEHAIADGEDGRNPTSGVYRLTESIRGPT